MKSKFEGLKQVLYVLLPLLVFVVLYDIWTALTGHVLGIVLRLFGANGELWMENNTGTFQAVCIMGGLVGACVCLFKTAVTDGFLTPKKDVWKQPVWQYVIIVLATVLFSYGMNYLFTITGFTSQSAVYQVTVQNQYDVAFAVGLLLYGVISPFVEELVFRGFLYGRMRVYMPKNGAVLVSALLFGIYHGNMVQGIYGFLMGILFTLAYDRYKNFYLSVIMHVIVNLVGYFVQLFGFI